MNNALFITFQHTVEDTKEIIKRLDLGISKPTIKWIDNQYTIDDLVKFIRKNKPSSIWLDCRIAPNYLKAWHEKIMEAIYPPDDEKKPLDCVIFTFGVMEINLPGVIHMSDPPRKKVIR
jgi:hypothetical protein